MRSSLFPAFRRKGSGAYHEVHVVFHTIATIGCDIPRMCQKFSTQITRIAELNEMLRSQRLPQWKVLVKNDAVITLWNVRHWIRTGESTIINSDMPRTFCESLGRAIDQIRTLPDYKE